MNKSKLLIVAVDIPDLDGFLKSKIGPERIQFLVFNCFWQNHVAESLVTAFSKTKYEIFQEQLLC